jgi:hemerythrin-like metal-binding protein
VFARFAPGAVSCMRWGSCLCLDIPVVDRDHRQLIDLLTRVQLPNQGPDVYELVQATVDDLADHVAHHFDREEMLMRLVAFPDAARHCKSHSAIAARVREFQSLLRRGPARFPHDRFCAFLSGPILSHLLDEDMQIRPWVDRLTGEAA